MTQTLDRFSLKSFSPQNIWIKFNELKSSWKTSQSPRIYFYHIRKAGGTSLVYSFLSLLGDPNYLYRRLNRDICINVDGKVVVGWNTPIIEKGKFFFSFSHAPYHSFSLPEDTFTMSCFRDPMQRVISHYKMLYSAQNDPDYIKRFLLDQEMNWLGSNFEDFLSRVPKEHLLRQLYMFSKTFDVDEAYENIANCSFYWFVENYNDGLQQLAFLLNLPLKPYRANQSSRSPTLNQSTLEMLRESLEPEYKLIDRLKKG